MNRLLTVTAIAAILLFTAATSWGEIVDRVVAVVNDDVITQYEVDSTLELILKRNEQNIRPEDRDRIAAEGRKAILEKMIDDLIIRQEARRLGIVVREEELTSTIQEALARRNLTIDNLQEALIKDGTNYEKYREATRTDMLKTRIMQREIRPRVTVTNEEIGAFYQEHRDEYEGKLRVRLLMIALPVPAGSDEAAQAAQRAKAESILQRIRAGEYFEVLANENSPGQGRSGGDIGYVEKGTMNPSIEEVAFNLKPGEVSGVIETPQGFYIIKALDKRGGGSLSLKATRSEIEERLFVEKMDKKFAEWIAEKRQKAHIEIRL
ncbi:MAG TPA: peptidylprolyl isomerase [Syntrophales bacterium]|nr:peptidylprolyl isomerase [Syntrophales bacterium]